jgi:cytochrome c553
VVQFTWPQLKNLFAAVDWYPDSHTPMPEIVALGRPPRVNACGYCHTPAGQGRPENAPLAALPAAYIIQQVMDFKSGARRNAGPASYRPNGLMVTVAEQVGPEDLAAAAAYFAAQPLRRRVIVQERARIPHLAVVGLVYARSTAAGDEPLGARLVELSPDPGRHEKRDEAMPYVAYVPRGSVARGRILAGSGDGVATRCNSCHGEHLQGAGLVPRLAGVSPSYVLRQLIAFQSGARRAPAGEPMQTVVAHLDLSGMIDAAAYAASLPAERQGPRGR